MRAASGYFLGGQARARRRSATRSRLTPSPGRPWILDHDNGTPTIQMIAGRLRRGGPRAVLTRDHVLDNITLYWLDGPGASAARRTGERNAPRPLRPRSGQLLRTSRSPSGFTHFPRRDLPTRAVGRVRGTPASTLHEGRQGGHFAAWEEPIFRRRGSVPRSGRFARL